MLAKKPLRSSAYLAFVRTHPCAICKREGDIHAHHIRLGNACGIGTKPSDYRTVPLCPQHHHELHQKGERTFWNRHEMDPDALIIRLLLAYTDEGKAAIAFLEEQAESRRAG
ncbi:MAG: hypothetical protein ACRCXD_15050 [Luteolibacter sp.]